MNQQQSDPMSSMFQRARQAAIARHSISLDRLPVGSRQQCETCGELIEVRETAGDWKGKRLRYWSDCRCHLATVAALAKASADAGAYHAQQRAEGGPPRSDLRSVRHMTLGGWLGGRYPDGQDPAQLAIAWLEQILPLGCGDYHRGPPVGLYFYSPGKGAGKTHLAAGIAQAAHEAGRVTFFADEVGFIERCWALERERRAALIRAAGETSWLTVIDDMGQREGRPASLRDAWYEVINQRWLGCGWTIITSNRTPDELLAQETINAATHSRLTQMIGRRLIPFVASDYRLEDHDA